MENSKSLTNEMMNEVGNITKKTQIFLISTGIVVLSALSVFMWFFNMIPPVAIGP